MNKVIYCPDALPKKEDVWVFLAGPIQGAEFWQETIEQNLPEIPGVTFLSPRRKENPVGCEDKKSVFSDSDYQEQVRWETEGLRCCDVILFWIPLPIIDIPGRSYAQTTRFELGENLARGKRIIAGCDPAIPGRRYFVQKLRDYGQGLLYTNLINCLEEVRNLVEEKRNNPKNWFTSDTHFGSFRALRLSRRPFGSVQEMDEKMVENWNRVVSPWDTIYHLGDFGNMKVLSRLNGIKKLVMGNYEFKEMESKGPEWMEKIKALGWDEIYKEATICLKSGINISLSHFPLTIKESVEKETAIPINFGLFGHIHGRQMIKKYGLDVGVDAHNFTPVSMEEVMFYYDALQKNYYDDEVFG